MDEIVQAALGQDHNQFLKCLHLRELNRLIRDQRATHIRYLSYAYSWRKEVLERLLDNKPRFDLIARLFYKGDVERARENLQEVIDEIHDFGLTLPEEDEL